ncbi:YqhG family protein [Hazenella coriacea]|uniref:Uncharacterized protein YqhG n=1 Tax=Hazenella coriacea TaxID=1179467 RepID=A0A4R3LB58_9BACL|nr:YqhG family protein [Hazenella coriacea]TCS96430.1 uncharacterized protein YqhG [Hazenella coriacea]
MDQQEVREFVERYMEHHQCQVIESTPSYLQTQLSIEVDKDLLNRPFYWMYVEKLNQEPQPAQFCFIFDLENHPPDQRGEYIFFGSPRFSQMLQSAQKHGRFVRLYQEAPGWELSLHSKPYIPWLLINFKLSYICDQKKDRLNSLGINLYTGEIKDNFYPWIQTFSWTSQIPVKRHLLSKRLSIPEAVGELEYYLQDQLHQEDLSWAEAAKERLQMEMNQLNSFYPEGEVQNEEKEKEKKQRIREMIWQYHPRVEIEVVNAGIFYMNPSSESLSS